MAKKKVADIKEEVKALCLEKIKEGIDLKGEDIFQSDGYTFAIPFYPIGEDNETEIEVFCEVKLTCKNWYATAKSPAYNPVDKENDYKFIVAQREQRAKEVAEKKAKKIAKQKEAKAKAEAKAE